MVDKDGDVKVGGKRGQSSSHEGGETEKAHFVLMLRQRLWRCPNIKTKWAFLVEEKGYKREVSVWGFYVGR